VNALQGMRAKMKGAQKDLLESFTADREDVYRDLADLLIDSGRFAEARQVLAMIKEKEYFDFVQRGPTRLLTGTRIGFTPSDSARQELVAATNPSVGAHDFRILLGNAEIKSGGDSSPFEHPLGGHGPDQAPAFPRSMIGGGADCLRDALGHGRTLRDVEGCFLHRPAQQRGDTSKRNRRDRQAGEGEPQECLHEQTLFHCGKMDEFSKSFPYPASIRSGQDLRNLRGRCVHLHSLRSLMSDVCEPFLCTRDGRTTAVF